MSGSEWLFLIVGLQGLASLFLLGLFWAFYKRLGRQEFFWWWLWAWIPFAVYLGAGWISLALGPASPLLKSGLVLTATGAGFLQIACLLLGIRNLARPGIGQTWRNWSLGVVLVDGVAVFSLSKLVSAGLTARNSVRGRARARRIL